MYMYLVYTVYGLSVNAPGPRKTLQSVISDTALNYVNYQSNDSINIQSVLATVTRVTQTVFRAS